MGSIAVTVYHGVCDRCGEQNDEPYSSAAEAAERMWAGLCWECSRADRVEN